MKTTYPKVASTRWLSLGRVLNWFSKHRDALISHFDTKAPAAALPPTWGYIYLPCKLSWSQLIYASKACKVEGPLSNEESSS
eukprot:IDg22174t1